MQITTNLPWFVFILQLPRFVFQCSYVGGTYVYFCCFEEFFGSTIALLHPLNPTFHSLTSSCVLLEIFKLSPDCSQPFV